MAQIIAFHSANTGDLCFHCRKQEYWWRVQIHSLIPEGIVNLCLCGECVLLPPTELLTTILRKE